MYCTYNDWEFYIPRSMQSLQRAASDSTGRCLFFSPRPAFCSETLGFWWGNPGQGPSSTRLYATTEIIIQIACQFICPYSLCFFSDIPKVSPWFVTLVPRDWPCWHSWIDSPDCSWYFPVIASCFFETNSVQTPPMFTWYCIYYIVYNSCWLAMLVVKT